MYSRFARAQPDNRFLVGSSPDAFGTFFQSLSPVELMGRWASGNAAASVVGKRQKMVSSAVSGNDS
jgi:hypothetical protein